MIVTAVEALSRHQERCSLPPEHLEHPDGFVLDDYGVSIYWGRYEYAISWDQVRTPVELLSWIAHISEKAWPGSTPSRISNLIRAVCERRNWAIG